MRYKVKRRSTALGEDAEEIVVKGTKAIGAALDEFHLNDESWGGDIHFLGPQESPRAAKP